MTFRSLILIFLIEASVLVANHFLVSPYSAAVESRHALPKTGRHLLATVLTVPGDVDAFTGAPLARDLHRCAAMEHPVIVDLRMLDFFGTRGVHVLIELHSRCRTHGLPSVLVVSTLVDRLISLTGNGFMLGRLGAVRAALRQLRGQLVRSGRRSAPRVCAQAALQC